MPVRFVSTHSQRKIACAFADIVCVTVCTISAYAAIPCVRVCMVPFSIDVVCVCCVNFVLIFVCCLHICLPLLIETVCPSKLCVHCTHFLPLCVSFFCLTPCDIDKIKRTLAFLYIHIYDRTKQNTHKPTHHHHPPPSIPCADR